MLHVSQMAAMAALASCGAFDEILRGPLSAAQLAARLSLDEDALARALELAQALGFLDEGAGSYSARRDSPMPLDVLLRFARAVPEHLRTGESLTTDATGRGELYAMATPALGMMFHAHAEKLAQALGNASCQAILDVGAGSGVWSLAMAAQHQGSVVTALDLAPVLDRFRERAGHGAHQTIAADYHQVVLEPRWDRVVLANVLHLEVEESARSLLARAASWRRPGGSVIVIDSLFRTETSRLALASYEFHLAMRVAGGRVYDAAIVEAWAAELGLEIESSIPLDPDSGIGALVLR